MKGTLVDFNIQLNEGLIRAEDSQHYSFTGSQWKEQIMPTQGQQVDFVVNELQQATSIYLATYAQFSNSKPSITVSTDQIRVEKHYGFFDWTIKCLKNYVSFTGRARRKEYWYFYLLQLLLGFAIGIISVIVGMSDNTANLLSGMISLAFLLPTLAVSARRLHDVNRSGWWMLLAFTIIGLIPLFIWSVSNTKPEQNKWGQPAK